MYLNASHETASYWRHKVIKTLKQSMSSVEQRQQAGNGRQVNSWLTVKGCSNDGRDPRVDRKCDSTHRNTEGDFLSVSVMGQQSNTFFSRQKDL